jgi:hypothetical protein
MYRKNEFITFNVRNKSSMAKPIESLLISNKPTDNQIKMC